MSTDTSREDKQSKPHNWWVIFAAIFLTVISVRMIDCAWQRDSDGVNSAEVDEIWEYGLIRSNREEDVRYITYDNTGNWISFSYEEPDDEYWSYVKIKYNGKWAENYLIDKFENATQPSPRGWIDVRKLIHTKDAKHPTMGEYKIRSGSMRYWIVEQTWGDEAILGYLQFAGEQGWQVFQVDTEGEDEIKIVLTFDTDMYMTKTQRYHLRRRVKP